MDTIYALATARGKAGVAVIRISGPMAWDIVARLTGGIPAPRQASLRKLRSSDGTHLDDALVLFFEEGRSFTGEQSAELQTHGSLAVTQAVLREISTFPGTRHAEPGEFTRRALENDNLDLTQVEALADLIEAETEAQRRQALRVLSGEIGQKVELWRKDLIRASMLVEATIDFADEDVPVDVFPEVSELVQNVKGRLQQELDGEAAAERLRHGFEVAIVGAPNVGKSTLLNALVGREAALTSSIAGTTRDIVEVRMDISGMPVTFLDTAGLRETDDVVESMGIERAVERAKTADLRLFLNPEEGDLPIVPGRNDVVRYTKSDLTPVDKHGISAVSGEGIADLLSEIGDKLEGFSANASVVIRQRHSQAFRSAVSSLTAAENEIELGSARSELIAEDLREAVRSLEFLIGRVDIEQLLGEIFSSFCIGK
ncbi:tRNA uridine-5-carboxymethylaminomethyl(34) synthesis GTPase MnmE [Brevirhabdus sp.]|uniref:tRNA uridine-5-carboxymethylaminomethyl(34) synthesis GTPase MnmE n=1 Tax=Brevirhabdus sp. TaxID=2004514 RepID=UPI00405906CF